MSVNPQQMQQMLALYKQQFPGQGGQQGPVGFDAPTPTTMPQGISRGAGNVQGASQLIMALMKAQKQKQIQQQLNQSQVMQGMPQANATQQSAIGDMLAQNPVVPIDPSQLAAPAVPGGQ
jgi:hypothetical protein